MAAVTELATAVGTRAACRALFASRASHYRQRRAAIGSAKTNPRPSPPRALAPAERETVLARCTENASRIARQPLFMRRCSMKERISVRFAPCIACSNRKANRGSAAIS